MTKRTSGSWVQSANIENGDFPIENLPYGCFQIKNQTHKRPCIGLAIGDFILPLTGLKEKISLPHQLQDAFETFDALNMNAFMALSNDLHDDCRQFFTELLSQGSSFEPVLKDLLISQNAVEMLLPCKIPDFTDFYSGIYHATNVGLMLRPDQPLNPNYDWIPVAYHGRSSSINPSGVSVVRPVGQTRASGGKPPYFQASRKLDYELELGVFIGKPNQQGYPIPIDQAERHFFGMCILNDWSARDIQAWEAVPLGPFLAKNFATTISPWIVTREALEPFRRSWKRAENVANVLPYLDSLQNRERGAIEIYLEVFLQTPAMHQQGLPPHKIADSEYCSAAHWTVAQLITHHASNGCNLNAGDLLGTGTLSGPLTGQAGSLLELSQGGKTPIVLPNGEQRTFLEDGDQVIMKAFCESEESVRIGFGACKSIIKSSNSQKIK
jgi:fumarylacetoacetase